MKQEKQNMTDEKTKQPVIKTTMTNKNTFRNE